MNSSILRSIIRSCFKAKRSLGINIIGLLLGFAVIIAISFYIREEIAYNRFHKNIDDLYCAFTIEPTTNNSIGWHETVPALPKALRNEYPEVKDAALLHNGAEDLLIQSDKQKNYEEVQLAEPNLFRMFSFPVLHGVFPDETTDTKIIALSRKMANKYFERENVVGEKLLVDNKNYFTVVAVYEDMPKNSTIRFDFWAPVKLIEEEEAGYLDTWYNLSFKGYVLLQPNVSYKEVNKKLYNRIQESNPESKDHASLFPFANLYLEAWGHEKSVQTMSLIGIIVILLVCLNFINLQTSEAFKRIKHFGIKKLNGAGNREVSIQLIGEALFQTLVALVIAVIITYLGKEYVLQLIGKEGSESSLISGFSVIVILICTFSLSILSGVIPAFTIKGISPTNSLKDKVSDKVSVKKLRYVFTAIQFCLAVTLIICLLTTNKQIHYLQTKSWGFDREQLLYIRLDGELYEKRDVLQQTLEQNSNVVNTSLSTHSPIGIYWNGGGWEWEGKAEGFDPQITYMETDNKFQETFGIQMAEGNYFQTEPKGVVINKTFAQMIAPNESALGKILTLEDQGVEIPVTGIIEDIHFKPLNRKIGALMIIPELGFSNMHYLFVKVSPTNMEGTLKYIETTVKSMNPDFPYWHHFLDDDFAKLYSGEKILRQQMTFFSALAIFISCMGLWGMLVFIIQQRVKEIGVRKVNGARVHNILLMLNVGFIKWIAISVLVACPIGWYFMNRWMEKFAYKINLTWELFAFSGIITLGIAVITISWQTIKAARTNPVKALRYE